MRRSLRLVAVALFLAGCNASPKQETLPPKQVSLKDAVAVEGPPPDGRFYVKAGERDLDSDLYGMTFSPPGFERLTKDSRVTTVGGCEQKVVVAAAQRKVGYADRLQELRAGKLAPVEALGLEIGSNPNVDDDCRILYIRLADAEPPVQEIKLWDPAKGTSSTVTSGETVYGASWGPGGEIAVLKREPGPKLHIIRPDGSEIEIDPQAPDVGNVQWGRGGWMAMAVFEPRKPPTATLFLNPATGERSMLEGWLPLDWSPDGNQVLVTDSQKGTTLGVVDLPDLTKVRPVGASTVGTVWDAVWLPA
ncbi:MAG: hypothetical protein ACRDZ3_21240 [Acidimicrobiia bacterium]